MTIYTKMLWVQTWRKFLLKVQKIFLKRLKMSKFGKIEQVRTEVAQKYHILQFLLFVEI